MDASGSDSGQWDVVVVGGGSAGPSAALTLVRARRRVLVLDAGLPRNRFSAHMHAVLGRDGTSPLQLLADGREEVERYEGVVRPATATGVRREGTGFVVISSGGSETPTRRVVVAAGLRDDLPALDGLADYWGKGVAVCPYCDAWEVADGRIGVLATGLGSPFQAQLLRQWSEQIIYLANTVGPPGEEDLAGLRARGIEILEGTVRRVVGQNGQMTGVEMSDGRVVELDAIFTVPTPVPQDDLLDQLGAERTDVPSGSIVQVDPTGETSVTGVWAVGNVVNTFANIPMSIGSGAAAGGAVNHSLVLEDVELAMGLFAVTG